MLAFFFFLVQLECDLWQFTWNKQTIPAANPSLSKALFSSIPVLATNMIAQSDSSSILSIKFSLQEMVDFLVDIWEQEGMYD